MPGKKHGENKRAHLAMIQGVVDRMAGNLFYLRGWIITLVAGALVLLTQVESGQYPVVFLSLTTILFWIYDGYFLALERMYRDLYDKVRTMKEEEIDFSMDITEFKRLKKNSLFYCIFSPTLRYFYGFLLAATAYVFFFVK